MAAKGTASKQIVFNKLMEVFPGCFWEDENKILRVPLDEDGARVEIKVTLTAAKTNLGDGKPVSAFSNQSTSAFENYPVEEKTPDIEPSQEEKENVAKLLASLGF
jgi:hypothetical protein